MSSCAYNLRPVVCSSNLLRLLSALGALWLLGLRPIPATRCPGRCCSLLAFGDVPELPSSSSLVLVLGPCSPNGADLRPPNGLPARRARARARGQSTAEVHVPCTIRDGRAVRTPLSPQTSGTCAQGRGPRGNNQEIAHSFCTYFMAVQAGLVSVFALSTTTATWV
jgi:hypothetical protein